MMKKIAVSSINSMDLSLTPDRRQHGDRRYGKNHPLSFDSLRGQRHMGRRRGELTGYYVDRYDPKLRVICLGIILSSFADTFFTLRILELGGTELNPVMQYLIDWNRWAFIYIKLFVTTVCIGVLVAHIHFKWLNLIKVSSILYACFVLYLVLIVYELFLLYQAYSLFS